MGQLLGATTPALEVRPHEPVRVGERGIDPGDGVLILKREVALEGRNRAWINGSPTTATILGELGTLLVSLHGQHEHQSLLHRDEQRKEETAHGTPGERNG